jgi:DNA-binding NarL/FixJ family response regulator
VIRVLVADDQALVRAGFAAILAAEPDLEVVGEAEDGAQAVERAALMRPDVVLMDVRMPRLDGIEATRRLHARPGAPRVLVLTTFGLDEYVYAALRAGAGGFLLKDAPRARLADAVRAVHAGEVLLAPELTRRLVEEHVRRPPPAAGIPAALRELTDREVEVLRHVAAGATNAEIAAALVVSEATVRTHVGHLLAKLGARGRVQAVIAAYESGLVVPRAREDA